MDIQNIILEQNNKIENNLLFHINNINTIKNLEQGIQISCNNIVEFDTYYNSFSVAKWKKYTKINNIGIRFIFSGKAVVEIIHCKSGGTRNRLKRVCINSEKIKEEKIEIGRLQDEGVIYFAIEAIDAFCLYEAGWCSEEVDINDSINLGLAICTYKKEELVTHNLKIIQNSMKAKELRPFNKRIHIFISDNGKTLDREKMENEYITIVPNKNCGGAGGFTRCIIEIIEHNRKQKEKFSHVILMDDDAVIEPEVIKRTILFLMCLKEQYKSYCLSGGMLYQEYPCIQHSSGEAWTNGKGERRKANYNLANFEEVILNEIEENIDYAGWFYCVIPLIEIKKIGLPLPLFIHCDDIEYGLRQKGCFITLNGINIWHPCFTMKNGNYIKYYDVRNNLILNSIYASKEVNTKHYIRKFLLREFFKNIPRYNYMDIELMLLGVVDFCKGINWIKKTDAERRHGELLIEISKLNPLVDVQYDIEFGNIEMNINKNKKSDYVMAMLNWVRPLKKENVIYHNDIRDISRFIGKNTVIIVDQECKNGRIYQKDYKRLIRLMKMLWETLHIVSVSYQPKVIEYRKRKKEISNIKFWKEYLELS